MRYRSKSVEVQAVKYEGQALDELPEFVTSYRAYSPDTGSGEIGRTMIGTLLVPTTKELLKVNAGEWLVLDGKTMLKLSDDQFHALYELIEDESADGVTVVEDTSPTEVASDEKTEV